MVTTLLGNSLGNIGCSGAAGSWVLVWVWVTQGSTSGHLNRTLRSYCVCLYLQTNKSKKKLKNKPIPQTKTYELKSEKKRKKHNSKSINRNHKQTNTKANGASLVAQWLRIRLPMQGTRVRALVWEDPTCRGPTKPVRHNY